MGFPAIHKVLFRHREAVRGECSKDEHAHWISGLSGTDMDRAFGGRRYLDLKRFFMRLMRGVAIVRFHET
ncbi:hypothetical protein [Marivita sp. S0852]|uniref:hypothetical protein n=1 Tax=Marivita sp. S0852 TaxID=3373893 RepID=UPI003981FCC5